MTASVAAQVRRKVAQSRENAVKINGKLGRITRHAAPRRTALTKHAVQSVPIAHRRVHAARMESAIRSLQRQRLLAQQCDGGVAFVNRLLQLRRDVDADR
jgi:hypothetical protein